MNGQRSCTMLIWETLRLYSRWLSLLQIEKGLWLCAGSLEPVSPSAAGLWSCSLRRSYVVINTCSAGPIPWLATPWPPPLSRIWKAGPYRRFPRRNRRLFRGNVRAS